MAAKTVKKEAKEAKLVITELTLEEINAKVIELKAVNKEQLLNNAMGSSSNVRAAKASQRQVARLLTRRNELIRAQTTTKEGEKE